MKIPFSNRHCANLILAFSILLALSGCASIGPVRRDVRMQIESSEGVIIQGAIARATKHGVLIAGSVRRGGFRFGPASRTHLDVQVIRPDGSVQTELATRYSPFPMSRSYGVRRSSHYSVEVPLIPPRGSTIRISHHATGIQECPYFLVRKKVVPLEHTVRIRSEETGDHAL